MAVDSKLFMNYKGYEKEQIMTLYNYERQTVWPVHTDKKKRKALRDSVTRRIFL